MKTIKPWIVYLDMDGPLADFDKAIARPYVKNSDPPEMFKQGFFRTLPITPGAKEAVKTLLEIPCVDLYIASKPTTKNLNSTIEKYLWVQDNFPPLLKKIFLTCDKGHLNGKYLIDDDAEAWEAKFKGTFIPFDNKKPELSWEIIVNHFLHLEKYKLRDY